MMITQAVKEAIVLVAVALGLALAVYALRPDKIGSVRQSPDPTATPQTQSETDLSEITLSEAFSRFKTGDAIFADSRHPADYEAGHIQSALNLTATDPDAWLSGFLAATDPATLIITYCDGDACHLATDLAELLALNGFENVRYLKNGWTRWRESGYPIE
jgi:rhodanese-related sulfurtransferase